MAIYNEILAARYARMLQKLFSMKGPPPVRQLAGEVGAVFPLFNGAENRYLEGWDRFGISMGIVAGGAGNFAVAQLRNPAGSNVIAVLERAVIVPTVNDTFSLRQATGQADFATLVAPIAFDARGRTGSSLILSTRNNVASAPGIVFLPGIANATNFGPAFDFITTDVQELPLSPGVSYFVNENTANTGFTFGMIWRERALEESERS